MSVKTTDPSIVLDSETAEELLQTFERNPILKIAGFSLWTFESMTVEAAQVIANSGMDILFLDSIREISPEVIQIFAESKASFLSFGLTDISPEVAWILSNYRGTTLCLDNLSEISPEVASILARFSGVLSLNGLQKLSVEVASALVHHEGELMLDGLVHLPEEVAQVLAKHQGKALTFEGIGFLSDGAKKALDGYGGRLEVG